MGQGDVQISADTYISSVENLDHSDEALIKVSNVTNSQEEIVEITFLQFRLLPPPAGSYLADLTLKLHFAEVLAAGNIRFHKCEQQSLETNVTYESHPTYNSTPFITLAVSENGSQTFSLHAEGGYTEWPIGGSGLIAITADLGTQVIIHSSEAGTATGPKMIFYSPFGILVDPVEQPWICYIHPFSWIPMLGAVILLGITIRKSV
jgi:hypothetical protein